MPTDGEGMEGRDTDGRLVSPPRKPQSTMRASERAANRAEKTLKLKELLDTWRTRAAVAHATDSLVADREERIYMRCAQELQEILDAS